MKKIIFKNTKNSPIYCKACFIRSIYPLYSGKNCFSLNQVNFGSTPIFFSLKKNYFGFDLNCFDPPQGFFSLNQICFISHPTFFSLKKT